eukprot:Blabericola_migrator_1__5201@NODE_267_length_10594_cov_56_602451_g223_i0_p3_GENE_NODE_267_length_10594_cov_56_602451_g223_i0NODE_267_length_10594_cov_56_602451_g223_i0_p3_ORF_typecomplete_len497_score44_30_NODE_267_length_10594_cov_56_602451_g223_i017623252
MDGPQVLSQCQVLVYGLDPASEKFSSPPLQILLCCEARRFASYCSLEDLWLLRQVSRVFWRWAMSMENQTSVLLRYIEDGCRRGFSKSDHMVGALQRRWADKVVTGNSWMANVRFGYKLLDQYMPRLSKPSLLPVGPPWEETRMLEWFFVQDDLLERCIEKLLFLCHFSGPGRYFNEKRPPDHDVKLATLLSRNPKSRLPYAESLAALVEGLLGSDWSSRAVLTREIVPVGQFDAVRDCLPYASEPELHITTWVFRSCICHPRIRKEFLAYGHKETPYQFLLRLKVSMERLLELIDICELEEEYISDSSGFYNSSDSRLCHNAIDLEDEILIATQPYIRGVLALAPDVFWTECLTRVPLPELTPTVEAQYIQLAESYMRKKHSIRVVHNLPWFNVSNLVVKGATIAHQLYHLDGMIQVAMKKEILAPFETIAPSIPRKHFIKVQVSALKAPADHPGDVCTLYVGPKGALMFTCNHAMLEQKMTELGWSNISLEQDC